MCTCAIREISQDEMGKIIEKNYLNLIECDWEYIRTRLEELPTQEEVPEDEEYATYIYFKVHKDTLEVSVSAVTDRQYWGGESHSEYWVANMLVFSDTAMQTFLNFDCASECNYYDDVETHNSKHLSFNDWCIPIENITGVVEVSDEKQTISFSPRGIFAKHTTEEIPRDCFNALDEKMGTEILVLRKTQ